MLKEKAGVIAGTIWNALNETEGMTAKQLKKATKLVDKDLFLGLGWLMLSTHFFIFRHLRIFAHRKRQNNKNSE